MIETTGPARVPEPQLSKQRRSALARVFRSLFVAGLVVGFAGTAAALYGYQEYTAVGPLAGKKVLEIEKGLGTPDIAARLEDAGIISDARVFATITLLKGARGRLKAGEYEFAKGASMRDVMRLIESGKSVVYKISIPEGWTSDAVVERIKENKVLRGDVTEPPAEGAIMPDTYVFKRGLTRQKMIDDMEQAQAKLLDGLWAARNPAIPLKTKDEALILASIVEKETGKAEERPVIASVFMNRLKQGMRLQSDPTIIYGITKGKGKLDHELTRDDIARLTLYNTYAVNGLPPGPIANPGQAALAAVMNPPATAYLYFVADGSGGHAFAATLEEHNKNVEKWRAIDKQAPATAMDQTVAPELTTAATSPAANTLPEIAPPDKAITQADQAATPDPAKPADTSKPEDKKPVQAETVAELPVLKLKPGSVIWAGKRLIPIPKNRPKL